MHYINRHNDIDIDLDEVDPHLITAALAVQSGSDSSQVICFETQWNLCCRNLVESGSVVTGRKWLSGIEKTFAIIHWPSADGSSIEFDVGDHLLTFSYPLSCVTTFSKCRSNPLSCVTWHRVYIPKLLSFVMCSMAKSTDSIITLRYEVV